MSLDLGPYDSSWFLLEHDLGDIVFILGYYIQETQNVCLLLIGDDHFDHLIKVLSIDPLHRY